MMESCLKSMILLVASIWLLEPSSLDVVAKFKDLWTIKTSHLLLTRPTFMVSQWLVHHSNHIRNRRHRAWIVLHSFTGMLGSWFWLLDKPHYPSGLSFSRRLTWLLHFTSAGFRERKRKPQALLSSRFQNHIMSFLPCFTGQFKL